MESKTKKDVKLASSEEIRVILNAVGLLTLLLSLALVVVLPLAEKIIYFYMGSLSFIEKEGLLTIVQALVLIGVYCAYRLVVGKKTKR